MNRVTIPAENEAAFGPLPQGALFKFKSDTKPAVWMKVVLYPNGSPTNGAVNLETGETGIISGITPVFKVKSCTIHTED